MPASQKGFLYFMAKWVIGKLAMQLCVDDFSACEITVDNVQDVLLSSIEKYRKHFITASTLEKRIIKHCMGRLWHYYYSTWDKNKQVGLLRSKKSSFILVSNFLKRYGNS